MKTQIHKATAEAMGIPQSKDGFYYHPNGMAIPLDKHNTIIAQIQSETKAWCLSDIEAIKTNAGDWFGNDLRAENEHLKEVNKELLEALKNFTDAVDLLANIKGEGCELTKDIYKAIQRSLTYSTAISAIKKATKK